MGDKETESHRVRHREGRGREWRETETERRESYYLRNPINVDFQVQKDTQGWFKVLGIRINNIFSPDPKSGGPRNLQVLVGDVEHPI